MQVQRVLEHRHAYVCPAAPYHQIAEEGVSKKEMAKAKRRASFRVCRGTGSAQVNGF